MTDGLPDDFEAVIGLEIHVQLATETKMFCGCRLSFGDPPNTHTCPVCLAHPGVLPVPNRRAIEFALQIALALDCKVAPRSIFHRKNYFYPDNPKAYQISQYDVPLASGGSLAGVRIHRAHLEEDAAKMVHIGESGRIQGSSGSLVDFNRAGTPLVEIVTEPDIRSAAEAREWGQLLRETVRQLGVSDVNMEEGSLRCDANVSIRPRGSTALGTKTELKNMNSFRFLEKGIVAELDRQAEIVGSGERVVQETLHFDPGTSITTKNSAEAKSRSEVARRLQEGERWIESNLHHKGVPAFILRPTLVFGGRWNRNINAIKRVLARSPFRPRLPFAVGLRNPIHADDLAEWIMRVLGSSSKLDTELAVVEYPGGEPISFDTLLARCADSVDCPVRTLRVNHLALRCITFALRRLPTFAEIPKDFVDRLAQDFTFTDTRASLAASVEKRRFRP